MFVLSSVNVMWVFVESVFFLLSLCCLWFIWFNALKGQTPVDLSGWHLNVSGEENSYMSWEGV